jgi:Ser/Thr protein kinase RdoA (MazF antagonist)
VFEDFEHHLLAMQAVPQPHDNWKSLLLAEQLEIDHVQQFGRLLGTIHRNASQQGVQIAPIFDDRSFFVSLRIEPYYGYTASQTPEAASFLNALIDDTLACRTTLTHGDYSPKNILVYNHQLILLDHEVIHFGDPAFDLGFSLTHLLSKAHHLPQKRKEFVEAANIYWQVYAKITASLGWAAELEARAVRHTLACLLARVTGRSPLEYLDSSERQRQRDAVLALMTAPPATVAELSHRFIAELERHGSH